MAQKTTLLIALIIFFSILIITGVLVFFLYFSRKQTSSNANDFGSYSFSVWSSESPSSDPNKNTCQVYTFPTSSQEVSPGIFKAIPGNPSYSLNVLNSLTGSSLSSSCLDLDQIYARQSVHTCSSPTGIGNGVVYACITQQGDILKPGESETFYSSSSCNPVNSCPGSLAVISPNFQIPSRSNLYCLIKSGTGIGITGSCDPGNTDQVFKIILTNPGLDPSGFTGSSQGQNGVLGKIFDRDSGLCLAVNISGGTSTISRYEPSSVGCSDSSKDYYGYSLGLTACTGASGAYPGYNWIFMPSIAFCGITGGCNGCTGSKSKKKCKDCSRETRSNICSSSSSESNCTCEGYEDLILPQQLIYIGDLNYQEIPLFDSYKGLTGTNAIIQWLLDNNAKSLYFGGSKEVIARDTIGLDIEHCQDRAFSTQKIDLLAYNSISNLQVCIASKSNITNCYSF
jgi:hypothetical protein